MIEIKISTDGDGSGLYNLLPQQFPLENCRFHITDDIEEYDYWVALHCLKFNGCANCPPENTIYITGEPSNVKQYSKRFLKQFGTVVTAQPSLPHKNVIVTHQILTWQFKNKTYDELRNMQPFEKTKLISIVSSNKRFSKEHEQRYQYAIRVKKELGNSIDLFGRGIQSFDDKWDVLAPYKFSIAIENHKSRDYISEKLTECFLTYTYPLYYGCTNVEDYYPKGSYEWIDITDLEGSLEQIRRVMSDPSYYTKHLTALCEARKRYLEEYDLFPAIANVISKLEKSSAHSCKQAQQVHLKPHPITISDIMFKGRCAVSIIKNMRDSFRL